MWYFRSIESRVSAITVLGKGRAYLRRRHRHSGNFVGSAINLADAQCIKPLIEAHHPDRGHRYRLRFGAHAVVCGIGLRQFGPDAAPSF